MSGGRNKSFMANPQTYMQQKMILSKSHLFLIRRSGVYEVDLISASTEPYPAVYVEPRTNWGRSSHKIPAYYLCAMADEINDTRLSNDLGVSYFFTDLLTGCQFLAYGNRNEPNIEHNNTLDGGVDYGERLRNAQNSDWNVNVSPGEHYNLMDGDAGSVVGVKGADGPWTFYFQKLDVRKNITVTKMDF